MGIREYLTEQSNHLIDWNRPGSLFFSNHQYTNRELLERGFVITSTAVMGFLGWNQSIYGGAIGGAALGFLISHTITMSPLIYKRLVAQWACDELKIEINNKLTKFNTDTNSLVQDIVSDILKSSKTSSASETWGRRQRLLINLLNYLNNCDLTKENLYQDLNDDEIIDRLDKNSVCPRA